MEEALKELKSIVDSWMDLPLAQDWGGDLRKLDAKCDKWYEELKEAVEEIGRLYNQSK